LSTGPNWFWRSPGQGVEPVAPIRVAPIRAVQAKAPGEHGRERIERA
jgi:hypothetical protein